MTIQLRWNRIDNQTDTGKATVSLPCLIGRAAQNDLIFDGYSTGISRFHAVIMVQGGFTVLQDSGSTNGIYVNKRRIYQMPLLDKTTFLLGNYQFTAEFLVQCRSATCGKLVPSSKKICPWCGQFSADAITRFAAQLH